MALFHFKNEKSIDNPFSLSKNLSSPEHDPEDSIEENESKSVGPIYPDLKKIAKFMQGESVSSALTGNSILQRMNKRPKIYNEILQTFLKQQANLPDLTSKYK